MELLSSEILQRIYLHMGSFTAFLNIKGRLGTVARSVVVIRVTNMSQLKKLHGYYANISINLDCSQLRCMKHIRDMHRYLERIQCMTLIVPYQYALIATFIQHVNVTITSSHDVDSTSMNLIHESTPGIQSLRGILTSYIDVPFVDVFSIPNRNTIISNRLNTSEYIKLGSDQIYYICEANKLYNNLELVSMDSLAPSIQAPLQSLDYTRVKLNITDALQWYMADQLNIPIDSNNTYVIHTLSISIESTGRYRITADVFLYCNQYYIPDSIQMASRVYLEDISNATLRASEVITIEPIRFKATHIKTLTIVIEPCRRYRACSYKILFQMYNTLQTLYISENAFIGHRSMNYEIYSRL